MERRTVLRGMAGGALLSALGLAGCSSGSSSGSSGSGGGAGATGAAAAGGTTGGSLVFDPTAYTELTTTVTTASGAKEVVYRFWKAITYVAHPVDATYQSLVVSVPVKVAGKAVDATDAPILLANSVGGYMPASVATATGIGGAGGGGGGGTPPGGAPSGAPSGMPTGGAAPGGQAAGGADASATGLSGLQALALAAGYVVVEPGARGRTLVNSAKQYYGVAPAAVVDLKAAVRYVRANAGRIPGDVDRIVTCGTSAGGALSALLGASGDSPLYDAYLDALGAADAGDAVFASGCWCPITDLEHADMAYEWNWGANALAGGSLATRSVSKALAASFPAYQRSLGLTAGGFGAVTADRLGPYLVRTYLQPSATAYLKSLSATKRAAYLTANPFITWSGGAATFTWTGFLAHVGARKKGAPAFDAFDLSAAENNLFGKGTTKARHFTLYGLRTATKSPTATLARDLPATLNLMNPMYFLARRNAGRARHWWLRVGTKDTDTALSVVANLGLKARNLGDDVDAAMYWDAGHGADEDPAAFIAWIGTISA